MGVVSEIIGWLFYIGQKISNLILKQKIKRKEEEIEELSESNIELGSKVKYMKKEKEIKEKVEDIEERSKRAEDKINEEIDEILSVNDGKDERVKEKRDINVSEKDHKGEERESKDEVEGKEDRQDKESELTIGISNEDFSIKKEETDEENKDIKHYTISI